MACPPSLKPITKYLLRAREVESQDPIVAYYCNYYSLKRAVELRDENDEGASRFLVELLEKCDRLKSALQRDDGSHKAHVEHFALSVFDYADSEDREGKTTKATAQTFFAAMCYLDVCSVFGVLSPALSERQRYAQKRAAVILKALRQGQSPPPPPSGSSAPENANNDNSEFSPQKFATPDSFSEPPPTSLYPKPFSDSTSAKASVPPAPEEREYESEAHSYEPSKGPTQENSFDYPLQAPAYPSSDAVSPLRARDDPPDDILHSPKGSFPVMPPSHNSNSPPHLKYSQHDSSPSLSSLDDKFSKAMVLYGPEGPPLSTNHPHPHGSSGGPMDPVGVPHGVPYGPPMSHPVDRPGNNFGYPPDPSSSFLETPLDRLPEAARPGVPPGSSGPDYPMSMHNRFAGAHNVPLNAPAHPMYESGAPNPQLADVPHALPHNPSHGFSYGPPHGPGHTPTNAPYIADQGSHHGSLSPPPPSMQTNPPHGIHNSGAQGSDQNSAIGGAFSTPTASIPASTGKPFKPSVKEIRDAQRFTRNAVSALDFQDVVAAKSNLEQALRLISR